jgi:formylglycine-generating enzyme required for sulfatase activity
VKDGDVWLAETRRVLEPLATALAAIVQKKGPRSQVQAAFKKEVPVGLKKIENAGLARFAPVLAARLATLADEIPLDATNADVTNLATLALSDLLGEKPFHEIWNESLVPGLPEGESFRKARQQVEKATWDRDIAKDPLLQWQRGAPAGFARVPAGAYYVSGTRGYGPGSSRKGRKGVTLAKDVHIGLREVTHAEYFEWWKTLDADARQKHLPASGNPPEPLWKVIEGAELPEVPRDLLAMPVSGVRFASAMAYAKARGARLPTEIEWCAAAGGREGRAYPWGDTWQPEMCNDAEANLNDTVPVGSMPGRGPFGHFDLAGNVAEWTATYESGKEVDAAKIDDANVVIRGGSYAQPRDDVATGWLWYGRAQFDRSKEYGFRLAMDVK